MAFPNEKEIKKMRKKLGRAQGFLMLSPDADELAKFRFKICQDLLKYSQKENLNAAQMAKFLGIPKSDMSRIFNHRIDRFSTDKLVRLFAKIKPNFQLKVA
jgi:predicted XRE-type DNA-binding protein